MNVRLPLIALVTTAALATSLTITSRNVAALPSHPAPSIVEHDGRLAAWHVDERGAVSLSVMVTNEKAKNRQVWFRSPPSATERTQLEHMLIVIGLHAKTTGSPVVLRGEREGGSDGSSPQRAYELVSIASK